MILSDFRFGTFGIREMRPVRTIMKSRTFQPSLR